MISYIQNYKIVFTCIVVLTICATSVALYFLFFDDQRHFIDSDLASAQPPQNSPYQTLDGVPVEMSQYLGQPLIVNLWATWVPFSQIEFPILSSLADEYKDTVHVVAVNRKENAAIIKAFLATQNPSNNIDLIIDPSDHYYTSVGGYAMPETILYDKNGVIVWHKRGVLKDTELREHITKVLP